ncbi:MAG: C39 family peptidase [Proteobacteria bacterium]|nr:C39 family peptidase [Pseudomonadota bacterium]
MKTKSSCFLACVIVILTLFACGSNGNSKSSSGISVIQQPYEKTAQWSWVAPIDGSGYCGPAALYHIISYYGDYGLYDSKNLPENDWAADLIEIPVITSTSPLMYIDDTSFGSFIQPDDTGSSWSYLERVANLYYSKDDNAPLYDVYVCSSHTLIEDIEIRRARLTYIREHLLNKDMPVVIHLDSSIPFLGHYVTLIGYSSNNETIYYVDSMHNDR